MDNSEGFEKKHLTYHHKAISPQSVESCFDPSEQVTHFILNKKILVMEKIPTTLKND